MDHSDEIVELKDRLQKYEQKTRDLVAAYKTLQKEKDVLQETLKSLSNNNVSQEGLSEIDNLKSQVHTLSQTISTLNEEKKKMEKKFLDDKKYTRDEHEKELKKITDRLNIRNGKIEKLRSEIGGLQKEMDHWQMSEQTTKSLLYKDIESLKEKLDIEKDINKKERDKNDKLRFIQNDLEAQLVDAKLSNENRITQLENAISELSGTIGDLEKQNIINLETISKQHDRIKHLTDFKNPSTRSKSLSQSDTPDILQFSEMDNNNPEQTIQTIVQKMTNLRMKLIELDPNLDIISIITKSGHENSSYDNENNECKNVQCIENLKKLNDLLLSIEQKKCNNTEMNNCCAMLNKENGVLKSRINELQQELYNIEIISTQNQKVLKDTILKNEFNHKQEVNRLKMENSRSISDIQTELTKHRNRTINLLSEKDVEIQNLQKQAEQLKKYEIKSSTSTFDTNGDSLTLSVNNSIDKEDLDDSKIDQSCPLYQCCETKARMEMEIRRLHQHKRQLESQLHRMEADIEYIKSDWHNEVKLLNEKLQRSEIIKQHQQQHGGGSISHGNISHGDEGCLATINMEYLKNVFRRFLHTEDTESRRVMAKAIGQVLEFPTSELIMLDKVKHFKF